jgi:hypothetical protein
MLYDIQDGNLGDVSMQKEAKRAQNMRKGVSWFFNKSNGHEKLAYDITYYKSATYGSIELRGQIAEVNKTSVNSYAAVKVLEGDREKIWYCQIQYFISCTFTQLESKQLDYAHVVWFSNPQVDPEFENLEYVSPTLNTSTDNTTYCVVRLSNILPKEVGMVQPNVLRPRFYPVFFRQLD